MAKLINFLKWIQETLISLLTSVMWLLFPSLLFVHLALFSHFLQWHKRHPPKQRFYATTLPQVGMVLPPQRARGTIWRHYWLSLLEWGWRWHPVDMDHRHYKIHYNTEQILSQQRIIKNGYSAKVENSMVMNIYAKYQPTCARGMPSINVENKAAKIQLLLASCLSTRL